MGKPQIVLAIPTGRPLKSGEFPQRVVRLGKELNLLMPEFEVSIHHSACPREAHAVNLLIEEFRNHPTAIWFVWMDLAVEATAEQLHKLLTAGVGVCGAICVSPENSAEWDASFYQDVLPNEHGLFLLPELGAHLKVFHRQVFDRLERDTPDLAYMIDFKSGRSCGAFCQERIGVFGEGQRLLSPSAHLDYLCRKANIGIWAHADVVLKRRDHNGQLQPEKDLYRPWLFKREPPPVCVEELADAERDPRPIAIFLQYCDKDQTQAERLFAAMGNLAPAWVNMFYSPGDKYPKAPNDTALSILRSGWKDYKAVLLIEPDCCPLTPDWLDDLSAEWDKAANAGYLVMGSWHPVNADHPTLGHLNGNLMFSPDLAKRITIPDVPDDKPWDTYLAATFAPHWCRTGLIKNLNRHKTASTRQLTVPECGTRSPVLVHGVKDSSAWDFAASKLATK